jgi:hypothetical protein
MYSNSPFNKYFFPVLSLWIIFLGAFIYYLNLHITSISKIWEIAAISSVSYILNTITILYSKFKNKRKIWALAIYNLLFIPSCDEFANLIIGISYLLLSVALLLLLNISTKSSQLKYFNIGMLTSISSLLYFPTTAIVFLFLFMTIIYYKEKINISQYIAGVLVTVILTLEITFITDSFSYLNNWINQLTVPTFHFEYQIPILLILLVILIFGWISQYSNKNIYEDLKISSQHTILVFYLLFWILIYAFFMGDNFTLLIFVSLPVSLITARCI